MKFLITGSEGFIGSHLADFLLEKGEVYGTFHSTPKNIEHLKNKIKLLKCDITNKSEIENIINNIKPDYIFHMAAQSFVIPSWKEPDKTFQTNIIGTYYLLDAVHKAGINPVICIACSSAEYGLTNENEIPINEKKEFRPSSPYAVSKVATDMLAYLYWQSYNMRILRIRFFNITGPRKTFDACSDFAKGIVEVEKGLKNSLKVGNLEGIRDITDVRDAVKAIWLLVLKGTYGNAYNICSGIGIKMKDILNKLVSFSSAKIRVETDKEKFRPLDDPIFIGDNSKITNLGWKPEITIEKTLKDILEYWRKEK